MKNNYPDSLTIQQYLEGKLDPEVAHQLEKQALDDPFLWDALEGYSTYRDPAANLSILQRQLHERIVHLQENKKVFDLSWQRLSVAAAAAVMFISAGILFWMNSQQAPERLASQSQKPVEVNVIDRDSVKAVISTTDPQLASSNKKEARLNTSQNAPVSGWLKYREYLELNTLKFSPEPRLSGSVLLSFQVGTDGKLSNFRVVEGFNEEYDKEAIRIVRTGSVWTPASNGQSYEARLKISFPGK
ncbi:MAG: energy transducer TonB [Daejeonella sp.]|uniref:energy transducer TonB n=1 Tax=Daejeonella sp. TaxID=2805397 RepID=UPI003C793E89